MPGVPRMNFPRSKAVLVGLGAVLAMWFVVTLGLVLLVAFIPPDLEIE